METLINTKLISYTPEQPLKVRKRLSTSEQGKTYTLVLNPEKSSIVYQVDGVIIKEGNKCDKLVLVETNSMNNLWTEIFVELKGTDTKHAVVQLEAMLKNSLFEHKTIKKKLARIVAQKFPRNTGNSFLERARDNFKKKYNCDLKGFSSGNTDTL